MNIWQKLKEEKLKSNSENPILVLAPMADVTDVAFRTVIAKCGNPDVFWTEFVSADGLILAPDDNPDEKGVTSLDKLKADLKFGQKEHPIVAQIFGSRVENIKKVSAMLLQMGFDGVDLNMGCPDKSIEKQNAGAKMMKNPKTAIKVILAAKEGVGFKPCWQLYFYKFFRIMKLQSLAILFLPWLETNIPISIKTRLGYNHDNLEVWMKNLLKTSPDLITIHARTRKQMSKTAADWSRVGDAVKLRDSFYNNNYFLRKIPLHKRTLVFGNGDVKSENDAILKTRETKCDGVMIGRGIFGNPWFFSNINVEDVSIKDRLGIMLEHTKIFEKELAHKNFSIMKKHYKAYVEGFDGARDLRNELMNANNSLEVEKIINEFLLVQP